MKKIVKKTVALSMVVVLSFLVPGAPLSKSVKAAGSGERYIKELRLYITESKNARDKAEEWCEKQSDKDGGDWEVISDDVNKGAAGAMKSTDYVYICADVTDDPSEAITDIAVMNENGNYDEGAYEIMLKEQKDAYTDYVADLKTMIGEYRANYEKKLPTAVQAHDMLNCLKEDDSGKLMGDLLLTISDDDLAEVLLQAQGQLVLYIEQQLGLACDKGKNTFLDRMEAFGSYDGLRKKFLKAYNNNAQKADAALKANFHDRALQVLEYWDDINVHIDNIKAFERDNGLDGMSEEQIKSWFENNSNEMEMAALEEEYTTLAYLGVYKYDGKTLLDYFSTPKEEMEQNIKQLYPLVASLSNGQLAGANQGVSLYLLVQDAASQTAMNNSSVGKAAEIKEYVEGDDKDSKEAAEDMDEYKDILDENVEAWTSQKAMSVYEGVDRDIYKGGVAVTSTAVDFGKKSGNNWTDAFVDGKNHAFTWTASALLVGSMLSGLGAKMLNSAFVKLYNEAGVRGVERILSGGLKEWEVSNSVRSLLKNVYNSNLGANSYKATWNTVVKGMVTKKGVLETHAYYCEKAVRQSVGRGTTSQAAAKSRMFSRLQTGLSVFAVVLAVADIVMTVTTLIKYYNRDHLPIPHHMVDLSYNEDDETSFIAYKSVKDDEGEYGDLNGGSGKQWLAIYTTKDRDAGDPILADSFVTQYGSEKIDSGYSPLHFFGKPNAPQNLTYADGANGWSFNDKEGGTYCFFKRDANAYIDPDNTGTSVSYGIVGAVGGGGLVLGILAGFGLSTLSKRKKKERTK